MYVCNRFADATDLLFKRRYNADCRLVWNRDLPLPKVVSLFYKKKKKNDFKVANGMSAHNARTTGADFFHFRLSESTTRIWQILIKRVHVLNDNHVQLYTRRVVCKYIENTNMLHPQWTS